MELVVGVNSYMDIEEADSIVLSEYLPDEEEYKLWSSLDNDGKSKLIVRATRVIENLPFIGVKLTPFGMSWPRRVWGEDIECPDDIKIALLMNVLQEKKYAGTKEQQLQDLGVSSYKVKDASISFKSSADSVYAGNGKIEGIYTNIYNTYLLKWVF